MIISMYLDPYATGYAEDLAEEEGLESGVEYEYCELENALREAFPGEKILFNRDVTPRELSAPTFYVFDIGGMCATDYSGAARRMWARDLAEKIGDLPGVGFVPWSSMTRSSVRAALDDLVLGDATEEPDGYVTVAPHNLYLPPRDDDRNFLISDYQCVSWMKQFRS